MSENKASGPRALVCSLLVCVALGCATESASIGSRPSTSGPAASQESPSSWPPLPTEYVIGRAATPEDVKAGRAVFAAEGEGMPPPVALQIGVPQYAYCSPEGAPVPGMIVQAERAGGNDVVGFRPLSGTKAFVTMLAECRLLGRSPPAAPTKP